MGIVSSRVAVGDQDLHDDELQAEATLSQHQRKAETQIMTELVACTVVAHNYLPMARLVARSFLAHHPHARFVVAVIDRPVETRLLEGECFEILPITEIDFGEEGFEYMAVAYDVTEFATSVKPFVLRQLVQEADCVLYLDPDIFVYAPLDPLIEATLRAGWSLTPHCLEPIVRDGTGPTEREIMATGVYNLGYIGVTKAALGFLDWWAERLRRDALIDPANQLFTDQRWIDLAVPIFSPHIERSPSYNVAYWNVDQRNLRRDGAALMVGDEPLRFFHFSGYDPAQPSWLTKYQPDRSRTLLSGHAVLAELCTDYGAKMQAERRGAGALTPYGWSEARAGMPLKKALRRLFHRELVESDRDGTPPPPTPFIPGGGQPFETWLREAPDGAPVAYRRDPTTGQRLPNALQAFFDNAASQQRAFGSCRRVPRYLEVIWEERADLQAAYPEVGIGDVGGFLAWTERYGVADVDEIFLLGRPEPIVLGGRAVGAESGMRLHGGVDVVGYFREELGVGQAARLLETALACEAVPVRAVAIAPADMAHDLPTLVSGIAVHDTVVMAVNADQLRTVRQELGDAFFEDRYVIGQWFWEIEEFPRDHQRAFALVHEVWAATNHMRSALLRSSPQVPIELMPLPLVAPPVTSGVDKRYFGLNHRFVFLFVFDLLSVIDRKNPFGVIDAFCLAFPPGGVPVLVLKTINGRHRLRDLERLRWACAVRDDIILIDEVFDAGKTGALMACADCYVSLHRAEGLGLTMAEAMTLGKPVIATGYSGNLDFMTDQTAHLIPWRPIPIGKRKAPYPEAAEWADPDLDAAAAAMRRVFDDPHEAALLGGRASEDLATRFSPAVTGARMKQRLEEIWRTRDA